MRIVGSSPLARGLRCAGVLPLHRRRIIPARAGFTQFPFTSGEKAWDHPRSRGVYPPVAAGSRGPGGSSPLARGLLRETFSALETLRIIPARAGFTLAHIVREAIREDHPRSRGVYRR